MTKINFENAINELLTQIYAASPKEKELAVEELRRAVSAYEQPTVRLGDPLEDTDLFDNVPI